MAGNYWIRIDSEKLEEACSDVTDFIEEHLNNVITRRDFKDGINQVIYEESWEYVPYKTGKLSGTSGSLIGIDAYVSITSRGIKYKMPYAGPQYYNDYNHPVDGPHPLATSEWIAAAFEDKGDVIMERVEEVLEKYLKQEKLEG